jgi:hypothetical protein
MAENERLLTADELKKSIEGWKPQELNVLTLFVMRAQDTKTASAVAGEIIQIMKDWIDVYFDKISFYKFCEKYPDFPKDGYQMSNLVAYLKSKYGIKGE